MSSNFVGADETLFRIVESLVETGPMGVTETADRLDLTKSTAHRHLQTLAALGYAINDDGTYRLSHQWFHIGVGVKSREPFYRASRRPLQTLADRTVKTAWAAVEEGGKLIFVNGAGANPTHNPDILVGSWSSITKTAAGKAILAHLPPSRVADILESNDDDEPFASVDLQKELESIRSRGYAMNQGEIISGISAIGMPVVVDNTVYGSFAVSSSSEELTDDDREEALDALSDAVNRTRDQLTAHIN
ncbi:IclR family transcriptional regulator [Halobellus captivus]|uniref:IclR family transcriptional regulator n=1 Tax=Halobellus captivus TaxID=2592614 RepID=UPI0011A78EEE|nr:IclR family transcriptional regulator [Halobellus captivus]